MNSLSKQRMLKKRISLEKVDIVLLQETKCDDGNINKITQRIWPGCESRWITVEGASGGVATLWDPKAMEMEDFSSRHRLLTLKFKVKSSGEEGYITNAYGLNPPSLKRGFLDEINLLGSAMNHHVWILGGDFNMIKSPLEKKGGLRRLDPENVAFGELIERLCLVDVPTKEWSLYLE
jgi:exonuclease III